MTDLSLPSLRAAADMVHAQVPPTPQYACPLLAARTGCDVWIKHENHTPTGAFKVRGAIPYIDWLRRTHPQVTGIITATRGNHGQSIPFAARRHGIPVKVWVPHGNSVEKNAAMRGFGATLMEHGRDFNEALDFAVAMGARVWVTSSSQETIDLAVQRGAQGGVVYTDEGWAKTLGKAAGPIDVVFDGAPAGGFPAYVRTLAMGARVVVYGSTAGRRATRISWLKPDLPAHMPPHLPGPLPVE